MNDLEAPPPRPSTARLSAPPMAALEELTRPRAVAMSFWCWVSGSVLVGVLAVLAATRTAAMRAEFHRLAAERDPDATPATLDRVTDASVLIVVGTGALLALVGLALAGALHAGRGWARVLLTVVAVAAVAYATLVTSVLTGAMLDGLRTPVIAGLFGYTMLILVAAVGMYLPGGGAWFRRPKGR